MVVLMKALVVRDSSWNQGVQKVGQHSTSNIFKIAISINLPSAERTIKLSIAFNRSCGFVEGSAWMTYFKPPCAMTNSAFISMSLSQARVIIVSRASHRVSASSEWNNKRGGSNVTGLT